MVNYSVVKLVKVMKVSKSGYYAWLKRKPSNNKTLKQLMKQEILTIYLESNSIYGAPKITEVLRSKGRKIAVRTVGKYMKEIGICSIIVKKFKAKSRAKQGLPYENILNQKFTVDAPNVAWVTDITYIWTKQHKWVYLASVMDLYSRKIIGYSLDRFMDVSLVTSALKRALANQNYPKGVIHHSDRGSQYTSNEYLNYLGKNKFIISFSGKGNCYDNACIEAFHSILKRECIYRSIPNDIESLRYTLFKYLDGFYNRKRIHGTLNYKTPETYENDYYAAKKLVA